MPKNLSEALKAAKNKRNVQSKHIIWESGVSKSQFYRIINGTESPSSETKEKISKSLCIDTSTFNQLYSSSKSEEEDKTGALPVQKSKSVYLFAVLSIFLIFLTALIIDDFYQSSALEVRKTVADKEDSTLFIKDVTIPDGSSIPVNTEFKKIWRVKNTGTLIWEDRYLRRMTPASDLVCSSPKMVKIPKTLPGQVVDISVTFVTPHLPGSCRTDWKTSDRYGNLYFPDMHGLYSIVIVTVD